MADKPMYSLKRGGGGSEGKSAFEVAVDNGFEGTEEEWLTSLHGKDGTNGEDGSDGNKGEPGSDGVDGDKGEPGPDGDKGEPGSDGDKGEPGPDGADGDDGTNGTDGSDGFPSEEQWNELIARVVALEG